jgi:aminopeptidase
MDKYADVLLWGLKTARGGKLRRDDLVLIRYDLSAVEMAERLYGKILHMGMHPVLRTGLTPKMECSFFEEANSKQLTFHPPGEKALYQHLNGAFYLHSPQSLTHLSHIDPKKLGKVALSRKPLRDILDRREARGEFGWTLCIVPTPELAKQADLTMREYTNQIVKACYLDRDHPVREWKTVYRQAGIFKGWMNSMKVKYYHVRSKNTDLKVVPGKRRRWIGLSGHNIPSFEIFTSPDWRGTEGIYFANQPSFRSGNYVKGVRLEFKEGKAVKIEAEQGRDFVVKQLSADEGASKVGEFSLTDKRFSRIDRFMANTLFDENFGGPHGNCHIALGAAYADAYDGDPARLTKGRKKQLGFNDSSLHWDLVNTEKKTVTAYLASGREVTVYENGVFTH